MPTPSRQLRNSGLTCGLNTSGSCRARSAATHRRYRGWTAEGLGWASARVGDLARVGSGTLLVAVYGEGQTRGRCAELAIDATCNQACAAIALHGGLTPYRRFIRMHFDASYGAHRMLASGGVQPNLNSGIIKDMVLPIPPIAEQARIVEEAERQFSFIEAAERAVDAGLARSAALRRSVLKAAFDGRLVPQDPSDEPASVLLEWIRASRPPPSGPCETEARVTVQAMSFMPVCSEPDASVVPYRCRRSGWRGRVRGRRTGRRRRLLRTRGSAVCRCCADAGRPQRRDG